MLSHCLLADPLRSVPEAHAAVVQPNAGEAVAHLPDAVDDALALLRLFELLPRDGVHTPQLLVVAANEDLVVAFSEGSDGVLN